MIVFTYFLFILTSKFYFSLVLVTFQRVFSFNFQFFIKILSQFSMFSFSFNMFFVRARCNISVEVCYFINCTCKVYLQNVLLDTCNLDVSICFMCALRGKNFHVNVEPNVAKKTIKINLKTFCQKIKTLMKLCLSLFYFNQFCNQALFQCSFS